MTNMATAKGRHQVGACRRGTRGGAPVLLLALLLSACANQPKAVAPVAEVKAEVKTQPAVVSQPAVTEDKPPLQLPDIPPPKKHDHNVEED